MRAGAVFRGITIAWVLAISAPAGAFDLPEVQLHGFLSQGYLRTSGNDFLAETLDGSTQFNEVGLAVTTELSPHLRLGLQLLSRDLGDVGNNDVRLDWAFADYRWRDEIGLRVGKIKLPIGLYNQGRDLDVLRAMVFLPQSVYDENTRDIAIAAQGVGAYGHVGLGSAGGLDYELVAGQNDIPDDTVPLRAIELLAGGLVQEIHGPDARVSAIHADNRHVVAGSLVYSAPLPGLRLGVSLLDADIDLDLDLGGDGRGKGRLRLAPMWVASVGWEHPSFDASVEWIRVDHDIDLFGRRAMELPSEGWYGLVTWHVGDRWHLSALYDRYDEDRTDRQGKRFENDANPFSEDFWGWRRDVGVAVRFDVDESWLVKAEWHELEGAALYLWSFQPPSTFLEERWSLLAIKASFAF